MLRNKVTMSRIAALAGCSKSAVGRHSLNCVPKAALKEHGAAYHRRRLVIQEEGNPPQYHVFASGRSLQPSEVDYDKDLFVVLRYGSKGGPSSAMLTRDEAKTLADKMANENKAATEDAEENKGLQRTCDSPAPEIIAPGEPATDS
jgi:hypothetical protein